MSEANQPPTRILFTIGHSNHSEEQFLDLLRSHDIEVLVDVRSQPFSQYATHFNAEPIRHSIQDAGIKYLWLGGHLGGRPDNPRFFDEDGHVLYRLVAGSSHFLQGIERLEKGMAQYRVAIMCSEEDPTDCHRHLLVARVLT